MFENFYGDFLQHISCAVQIVHLGKYFPVFNLRVFCTSSVSIKRQLFNNNTCNYSRDEDVYFYFNISVVCNILSGMESLF